MHARLHARRLARGSGAAPVHGPANASAIAGLVEVDEAALGAPLPDGFPLVVSVECVNRAGLATRVSEPAHGRTGAGFTRRGRLQLPELFEVADGTFHGSPNADGVLLAWSGFADASVYIAAYEVCECEGGLPVPSPLAAAAVAARPGFKREPAVRWPRSAQSHPGRHRLR